MYYRQQKSVSPKDVYLPISKLHSILAVAKLLAHNNISQICYCGQISLQLTVLFLKIRHLFGYNIYFAGTLLVFMTGSFVFILVVLHGSPWLSSTECEWK